MKNNKIITENLEILGERYKEKYLKFWEEKELENNSWQALKFFFAHSFMRGRRDELSAEYYEFTVKVLFDYFKTTNLEDSKILFEQLKKVRNNGLFNTDSIKELKKEKRNSIKHPEFETKIKKKNSLIDILTTKTEIKIKSSKGDVYIKNIYLQNDSDLLMVLDTLNFISISKDRANLYKYFNDLIKKNKIDTAYFELNRLSGIGDKLSTFLLRDIAILNNHSLTGNQIKYVFPVDTWVAQITSLLVDEQFSTERPNEIKKYFIENFPDNNLPLIAAGIWFLGFNSLNIVVEFIKKKNIKKQQMANKGS